MENRPTDRDAVFIARANETRRFFRSIGLFGIALAATVFAAIYEMAGLVALLAIASAPSAILSFLWVLDRKGWPVDTRSRAHSPRDYVLPAIAFCVTLVAVVCISLVVGATAGAISHLILYGAEIWLAASIRPHLNRPKSG